MYGYRGLGLGVDFDIVNVEDIGFCRDEGIGCMSFIGSSHPSFPPESSDNITTSD